MSVRRWSSAAVATTTEVAEPWAPEDYHEKMVATCSAIAAAIEIGAAYAIWQRSATNLHIIAMFASLICYVLGFCTVAFGLIPTVSRVARERFAIGGILFAFLAYAGTQVLFRVTTYGTDSMIFNAYSADLLLRGMDPYRTSLKGAFDLFGASDTLITPTVNGSPVYALSYPALSFLVYVPFLIAGVRDLLWVNVLAHLTALVTLAILAPRGFKVLAMLVLCVDASYVDYTVGSVTDILWVVPMLLCAFWWRSSPSRAAVALGVACAFKQTPWLVVPFALILWTQDALESRNWRKLVVPVVSLATAFVVPNAPFILWNPPAWVRGTFLPIQGDLVAFGSGIVQFSTSNFFYLSRKMLARLTDIALILSLLAYALRRRSLGHLPFIAPAIVLFFATRSLQNYFMFWPVIVTAYVVASPARSKSGFTLPSPFVSRTLSLAAACAAVLVIGVGVRYVAVAAAPANISLLSATFDETTRSIDGIRFRVVNREPTPSLYRVGFVEQGDGVRVRYWSQSLVHVPANAAYDGYERAPHQSDELAADSAQAVQVVAVDAFTGDSYDSRPRAFVDPGAGFRNASLHVWDAGLPADWNASTADFRNGSLVRLGSGAGSVVRFTVDRPKDGQWALAELHQTAFFTAPVIHVRVRPFTNYQGDVYPLALFGVELVDPNGTHSYFAIDSRLDQPKFYRREGFLVHVVPGKLGEWNDLTIDLGALSQESGFQFGPNTQFELSIIGAASIGASRSVRGDFGGIQ